MSATGASGYLDEIRANRRRSAVLLAATFALLLLVANAVAFVFGGYRSRTCAVGTSSYGRGVCTSHLLFRPMVLGITVALAAGYVVISYLGSTRATLSITGARPAAGPEHQQLRNVVEGLSIAAGTPVPDIYVIDDPAPNAFATGRNPKHAAVVATTGLLDLMSRRELEGVMAHEMSHVRNRDTSVMTLAVLTVGGIIVITDMLLRLAWFGALAGGGDRDDDDGDGAGLMYLLSLLLYALAVPAALLLRAALSRRREALADASAVELTRYPGGLRSALEKLEADTTVVSHTSHATAHLWIESPLDREDDRGGTFGRLFDTHPPLAERIALLRGYEGRDPAGRGPNDSAPGARQTSPAAPAERVAADDVDWQPDDDPGPGRAGGSTRRSDDGFGQGPFGVPGPLGLGGGRPRKGGGRPGRGGAWAKGGRILGGLGGTGATPGFGGAWVGKGRRTGGSGAAGSWPDGPWPDDEGTEPKQGPLPKMSPPTPPPARPPDGRSAPGAEGEDRH
jgi:heat shock protein HtpX